MQQVEARNIQSILNNYAEAINSFSQNELSIIYKKKKGLLNGIAHPRKKCIELRGDWRDLLSENDEVAKTARITLCYVIGHELGHMDNEPSKIYPSSCVVWFIRALLAIFRKDFRSQIREIRADYCGIILAMHPVFGFNKESRNQIITACFDYEIDKLRKQSVISFFPLWKRKDIGDSMHPSFRIRKELLTKYPFFNEQLIQELSADYSCNRDEVNQLCSCAFNGQMFDLATNTIKMEEKNG